MHKENTIEKYIIQWLSSYSVSAFSGPNAYWVYSDAGEQWEIFLDRPTELFTRVC